MHRIRFACLTVTKLSCDRSGGGSCSVAQSCRDMCVQAAVVLQAGFWDCVTPQERSAAAKCFGDGAVLAHLAALCWSYYSALGRIGNS